MTGYKTTFQKQAQMRKNDTILVKLCKTTKVAKLSETWCSPCTQNKVFFYKSRRALRNISLKQFYSSFMRIIRIIPLSISSFIVLWIYPPFCNSRKTAKNYLTGQAQF